MSFFPNAVNYQEPLAMLPPDAQNFLVVCVPSNGSSFTAGSLIQVDLGSRGFLDPASIAFRYKYVTTSASGTATPMVGTPAYTRLETLINSTTVEVINNYNTVSNKLTNLQLSVADKLGQQYSVGYFYNTTSGVSNEQTDGRTMVVAGETGYFSAPLIGYLETVKS